MLEILPGADDVIAIKLSGRLTKDDIGRCYDLLEAALDRNIKTHLFVEMDERWSWDGNGLFQDIQRGIKLIGRLEKMGRVAVVSDQTWVRWAAKIESALLPHISYRTFKLDQRDAALAWVEGKTRIPHGPSLKVIETDRPDVFGYELNGKLSAVEIDAISDYFNAKLAGGRRASMLGRICRYDGFEPSGILQADYFKLKFALLRQLDRYALVGGPQWLKEWIETLDPLFKVDMRHFAVKDEAAAWQWLQANPVSERPVLE